MQHDDRRPNQVWIADITYLPIGRGFLYLVAIIDWASCAVLAWRLSITIDVSFCGAALDEVLTLRRSSTPISEPIHQSNPHERANAGARSPWMAAVVG
ncbi:MULTISPECIES: DDE-type integrase/transposase/recombinase [Bradyrhizobium]